MPKFLLQNQSKQGLTQNDLVRFTLVIKPSPPQSTEKSPAKLAEISPLKSPGRISENMHMDISPIRLQIREELNDRLKISLAKLDEAKKANKIIHSIFNPTLPSEEVVLSFKKKKLTRGELLCFKEGSDLSDSIVDCYMSIIKIVNRVGQRPDEKVIVINTGFSRILFQTKAKPSRPKINIFENDMLVIPIYEGYWTLFVVNLKTGETHFYDGLMPNRDIAKYMDVLKKFLLQANIENLAYVNNDFIRLESGNANQQQINMRDSGIYICKVAEMVAQGRQPVEIDFKYVRRDMLNSLVRASLNLV
jgi:Ulp1 family protease